MSLNQLIENTYKPWLNVRVNNLTVDGVLPTASLSTTDGGPTLMQVAGLPPASANNIYRCIVSRIGKMYTFVFHIRTDGTAPGAVPAIISFTPAALALIPGYLAKNVNLEQTQPIFKFAARPGGAGVLFGLQAIQNTSTFRIVEAETDIPYTWDAVLDVNLNLSCTISVEAV